MLLIASLVLVADVEGGPAYPDPLLLDPGTLLVWLIGSAEGKGCLANGDQTRRRSA
jgi:hypothetical protein